MVYLDGTVNAIAIVESYCGRLYTLNLSTEGAGRLIRWRSGRDDEYYDAVAVEGSQMLCALSGLSDNKALVLQQTDGTVHERIFEYPSTLLKRLDSVGITGAPLCIPALNPHEQSLWLAIDGYDYLYITDMKGGILDSIHIAAPDYRLPPPPRSRVKSDAVTREWLSQWTSITSFAYVAPGYFVLQYEIGREVHGETGVVLYSTLAWDINRQPIHLNIDKHFQLAGVQPDGRLIFGHYDLGDAVYRVVLNIMRINP